MKPTGYLYAIPIALVSLDVYSTVFSLSLNSQATELNPFVASAIQYGSTALVPFLVSYLALSQGVALLMIATGSSLFGTRRANRFLPFSLICGVSSFGAFSNIAGILIGFGTSLNYVVGAIGSTVLAALVLRSLTGQPN